MILDNSVTYNEPVPGRSLPGEEHLTAEYFSLFGINRTSFLNNLIY